MGENDYLAYLTQLFTEWNGAEPTDCVALPKSGSNRRYFRMWRNKRNTAIGVYNPDVKENRAFLSFSYHFQKKKILVPEIYAHHSNEKAYLLQDLGDTTLYSMLSSMRIDDDFPLDMLPIYQQVLKELPRIQVEGGKGFDYSFCYPRDKFDKQSMLWDLNYFKYHFLKLADIPFDEQLLEYDFQRFTAYLSQAGINHFMFRDFQSRNIMLQKRKIYFIDYQGGRKGALQYDIASLLYDAKANIPPELREELFQYYLEQLVQFENISIPKFTQFYHGFVLLRIMQAMGAYGFRGFFERKSHFLQSIPLAQRNLEQVLQQVSLPVELSELWRCLHGIIESQKLRSIIRPTLKVSVVSFAYKYGQPYDSHGNGGGFVFDCRGLPNPWRCDHLKHMTGKDEPVIQFFEAIPEVQQFFDHIQALVTTSIKNYQQKGFTNLMINFGCTGGQHRSVYCAERLIKHLDGKDGLSVKLLHREENRW